MDWKNALQRSGTHTQVAFDELQRGMHVDFTAECLQQLVDAVVHRCALLCEAHPPGTSPAEIAMAIRKAE